MLTILIETTKDSLGNLPLAKEFVSIIHLCWQDVMNSKVFQDGV